MPLNYQSASEMIRNLSQIHTPYEVVHTDGRFRIIRFAKHWDGFEYWVVNEKGYLWEAVDSLESGFGYLVSPEAREYQASIST